jgi:hypothetical protein
MPKEAKLEDRNGQPLHNMEDDPITPALIEEELRRIVASRHFRTSRRGKEFLQYVVNQKISGNGDLLKERLIGVHIFGRKPDYATGEDPVVRVQAGDVRRRLESYHADAEHRSEILIQIPLGSYTPVFHLRRDVLAHQAPAGEFNKPLLTETDASGAADALPGESRESRVDDPTLVDAAMASATAKPQLDSSNAELTSESVNHPTGVKRWLKRLLPFACLALAVYLVTLFVPKTSGWTVKAFWAPASALSKPVLLCLPKPQLYSPSAKLFDRYRESHPNTFATREARRDQILPLNPTDPIQWGDMVPVHNSGPGIGGVVAAINISQLLTEQGIPFELRFGDEATYAEMRDFPVVLVGAINTDWTTQLTSGLNFVFDETPATLNIHETVGAKRVWKMETSDGHITRDYGLITRQLSGSAGQFLVEVAGISHYGTEAASELLANKKEFANALGSGSIDLKKKNLQIVVSTDVTNERAGPPHIEAISNW